MNKPTERTVFQNAWVVDDIESACMRWVNEMGVGPFFVTEYRNAFDSVTYRGQAGELDMYVALAQAGPLQIELIQPLVEVCAYRDSVPAGQTGFHHMCVWTDDVAADSRYFNGLGYATVNRGKAGETEFAYYDARPLMGCMLEVVSRGAGITERFATIAAAAENWQGEQPLRW